MSRQNSESLTKNRSGLNDSVQDGRESRRAVGPLLLSQKRSLIDQHMSVERKLPLNFDIDIHQDHQIWKSVGDKFNVDLQNRDSSDVNANDTFDKVHHQRHTEGLLGRNNTNTISFGALHGFASPSNFGESETLKKTDNLISLQSRPYNLRRKSVGRGRDKSRLKSLGDEFVGLDQSISEQGSAVLKDPLVQLGVMQKTNASNYQSADFFRAQIQIHPKKIQNPLTGAPPQIKQQNERQDANRRLIPETLSQSVRITEQPNSVHETEGFKITMNEVEKSVNPLNTSFRGQINFDSSSTRGVTLNGFQQEQRVLFHDSDFRMSNNILSESMQEDKSRQNWRRQSITRIFDKNFSKTMAPEQSSIISQVKIRDHKKNLQLLKKTSQGLVNQRSSRLVDNVFREIDEIVGYG